MADRKQWWIAGLIGVVIATMLLASSLANLRLEAGNITLAVWPRQVSLAPGFRLSTQALRALWQTVGTALLILLPIAIVYALLDPDIRKKAVRNALIMAAIALAYMLWLRQRPPVSQDQNLAAPNAGLGSNTLRPPTEFILHPPDWLAILITAGAVAGALIALWALWRFLTRRTDAAPLEALAAEAQEALDDLQAGADWHDAVYRCYCEMNRILHKRRGLRRGEAATPREFEARLKAAGLPGQHVERLTRLFETARYGAHDSSPEEQAEAKDCLAAIAGACEKPA